jgi:hypothetical protein
MIPMSTAIYDPSWWKINIDKNGVYNGLRCEILHPEPHNDICTRCKHTSNPENCEFITNYRNQLSKINFSKLIEGFNFLGMTMKDTLKFEEDPIIVLLVHEAPDNKCSERKALQEYFTSNGMLVTELDI